LYLYHNNAQESKENTVPATAALADAGQASYHLVFGLKRGVSEQGKTSWQGRC